MPNILIIEPHCNGHRAGYVRWIAQEAVARGYRVCVATFAASAGHPLFHAMQKELGAMLHITLFDDEQPKVPASGFFGLVRQEIYYRNLFRKLYAAGCRHCRPDIVMIPYLDYCVHALALLGSPFCETPWSGIVMRPAFHCAAQGVIGPRSRLLWIKKSLFPRLLGNKTLRSLFTIDETLARYIHETSAGFAKRLHYLADPAELTGDISKEAARLLLGIPAEVSVILVFGAIDLRKGIDSLLKALEVNPFSTKVHVLIAGLQERELHDLIDSKETQVMSLRGRIHQLNRLLTEEEVYTVFKASDIVWLGYRHHYGMSGVMVQAGQMGLPVVACKEGLLGWITKNSRSGVVVDIASPAEVHAGICKLIQDPSFAAECGNNGKARFQLHSVANFGSSIFQLF